MAEIDTGDIHHVLDIISSSIGWGSGFLDLEDVAAWNRVAEASGYPKVAVKSTNHGSTSEFFVLEDRS